MPSAQNPIRKLLDEAARSIGLSVSIALEIDSVTLSKDLVRDGLALAVLPFGAVKHEVETGTLTSCPIIDPEIRSDLNLIYLADRPPTRVASEVIDLFIGVLNRIVAEEPRHGFVEVRDRPSGRKKPKPTP